MANSSTDLVTRLRTLDINDREASAQPLMDEAADEIERLQQKLKTIADLLDEGAYGMATDEARGT